MLLRSAKELSQRVPPRRVARALRRLREQLPSGRPLTGLRVTVVGDDVVVREGRAAWEADSGRIFPYPSIWFLRFEKPALSVRAAAPNRSHPHGSEDLGAAC